MARPLLAFPGAVGSLAAIALACSDSSAPQTELARPPGRTGTPAAPTQPTLTPQQSGTTERLQAISPVDDQVAWASGTGGTYVLTTDGGNTWHAAVVPGAEALEFRDVQGVSDKVAYLLSAGPGDQSRIYKTKDAGEHWTLQFLNQDPNAFYDCFAFWTRNRGITTSDAVNGRFPAIKTLDGKHWRDIGDLLPAAQAGEASFAASGTCVATQGLFNAWIATGGSTEARILATTDGGKTWNAITHPRLAVRQAQASSAWISGIASTAYWERESWPRPMRRSTTWPGRAMAARRGSSGPGRPSSERSTA
jgi:photosystem II stability/assembly factor-like uncharacterized protein